MGIALALMKSNYYDLIAAALKEDIGDGVVTTDFFVPESLHATGRIIAHEKAVVAGTSAAAEVFRRGDPGADVQISRPDGDDVDAGAIIIELRGLARFIPKAEREPLNFFDNLAAPAPLTPHSTN